ncbi:MAG: ATP-dependent DNA helicase RecG [Thermodesulfovibrionales bacterium]|nr:ATP-dependent DNA helicase RecG [Thermodesulfovibrionales bacterium]
MVKDLSGLSVQYIKGVGPRRAALLKRLGISTVRDALYYLPYRYEDRRDIRKISELGTLPSLKYGSLLPLGGCAVPLQTALGRVIAKGIIKLRGNKKLFELTVSDGSGVIKAKWFNQPFMQKRFELGSEVVLSGTVRPAYRGKGLEMENPEYEIVSDEGALPTAEKHVMIHTGRIAPVYRATEGLSSRQLRGIIHSVLEAHMGEVNDPVPGEILRRCGLPGLKESIMGCHFPEAEADIESLAAWQGDCQRRLSFDELFMLELGLAAIKNSRSREKGIAFGAGGDLILRLRQSLPFSLTRGQEKAVEDILGDMKAPCPMNRLLQGDVGSGKTVCALMAMLFAVESGYQAALMAPTEILAGQHYINMRKIILELGLKVCLLTGSIKERPLDEIAEGKVDIVIGTHALIEEGIRFGRLGLAVIDEQHRFGVRQRSVLRKKAHNPDILIMTATPIPRTLAMTLYGDLDCSVIDSLPPGRTPVAATVLSPAEKSRVYSIISEEVKSGGQVYVVYPVIEESEKTSLKSAILGAEAMKKIFPALRVSLIHGRLRYEEREAIMMDFKRGDIDILVSTTVIEVGVDVPNASLMVIVHAERFGLSQLHQLRGRVGRGMRRSRCILLAYAPLGEEAQRRLDVMSRTSDGFEVAEEDLSIRGQGELMGVKQSGMPDLRVADILRDAGLLEAARKEAFNLFDKDPRLEGFPELRSCLENFWKGKVELFKTA